MKHDRDPQAGAQASAQAGAEPAGRIAGLLGMARRAGRLTTGFDAVAALTAGGTAAVVLVAADLSEKTEKELRFAARNHPSPFLPFIPDQGRAWPRAGAEKAGRRAGAGGSGICGVSDEACGTERSRQTAPRRGL